MKNKILLETKEVSKAYGKGEGKTQALDNVSLDIYDGELLAILGSSGSGKSTLLNIIGGMDKPDSGEVLYLGENICEYNDKQYTNYRKDKVSFVFQSFNLIQELTAKENIALVAEGAEAKDDVAEALEVVGLSDKANNYPSELSGGEQQRVSIARALVKKSKILLCDEPTGALDDETGRQVLIELERLCRHYGKTIVLVTHTKEIASIADTVVHMRNGRIDDIYPNEIPKKAETIVW